MTTVAVVVLQDPDSRETNLRCQALGAFQRRLHTAEGQAITPDAVTAGSPEAVVQLADVAELVGEDDLIRYIPTRRARERVIGSEDGYWPQAVVSRHRKLVRQSVGALFQFPLVDGSGEGDADSVETFVTDWTGLPSSCAVAVHPGHRLSTGLQEGERSAFTGRFCRHPLTGDLLPVWVGDWVKPEFGTGAVLLNPGHNAADLEFSRRIGLPVRFSLAPKNYDGEPADWLTPPFIRSGHAFRAGGADGLPFDEAKNVYFSAAIDRGLGAEHTDSGMGSFAVATRAPDGDVDVPWDHGRRTVAQAGQDADTVAVRVSSALGVTQEEVRSSKLTVVTPSAQVEHDLFALRLLLAEPGLSPEVKVAPEVIVASNAQFAKGVSEETDEAVLRLALLVSAGPLDTLSLKPQHIDPCERFLKVHETVTTRTAAPASELSSEVAKAAAQIKGLLTRQDLKQAFTQVYRLQKNLAKAESVGERDLVCYATLAHVLAGVSTPYGATALADTWQTL